MQSKSLPKALVAIFGFNCIIVFILIVARLVAEPHVIHDAGMQPTILVGDGIFMEKVSRWRGNLVERGAMVSFYPPRIEIWGGHPATDAGHVFGRLTGLPIFPEERFFIKRVIGLPGDKIRIEPNAGVYVNDKLLDEPYVNEPAKYALRQLKDIGGISEGGRHLAIFTDNESEIIVPKNRIFLLGDNRNDSEDSHTWGFLEESRVTARAWFMYCPIMEHMHRPNWMRPALLHGSTPYSNQ